MVITGLYNIGEVPFHEVYIHPKILDGYGETMSKTKGNGVDPLDVIEKFGTDALRFTLADLTTETQDVRMPVEFECPHCEKLIEQTKQNRVLPRVKCKHCGEEFSTQWAEKDADRALPRGAVVSERFEKGRNFCNKLWNAARFALMNLEGYTPGTVPDAIYLVEDRWILSRLATVTKETTDALSEYRYADAATATLRLRLGRVLQLLRRDGETALERTSPAANGAAGVGLRARLALAALASDDSICDRRDLAIASHSGPQRGIERLANADGEHHDRTPGPKRIRAP